MAKNVDITLLTKLSQEALAEVKAMRGEIKVVRDLANGTFEYLRKMEQRHEQRFIGIDQRIAGVDQRLVGIDQRITDLKDDLELMIKAELGGRFANFETKLDERLARIEQRLPNGKGEAE
jgi:hypothetical protein